MATIKKTVTKKGLESLLRKADKQIAVLEKFKADVAVALSSTPPGKPPKFPR